MKSENVVEIIRLILNKNSINITGNYPYWRFLMLLNNLQQFGGMKKHLFIMIQKLVFALKIFKKIIVFGLRMTKGDVVALIVILILKVFLHY